jgi:hypothetical protein
MMKTLVLVTQAYVHCASPDLLAEAAARARLVVVLDENEKLHPLLAPHVSEVYHRTGQTRLTLQPSIEVDDLAAIVHREIDAAGGDPRSVGLFCQHEDNVYPTAQVRKLTGIAGDGPELVHRFRDKLAMKAALAERLPEALPRYRRFSVDRAEADAKGYYDELAGALGTPKLVVKPTTGAGSFNVAIVNGPDDLSLAVKHIRSDDREFEYEVDEFIDGTMHQCDSFVRGGEVYFSGILELGCSNFDFVQGKPLSVYPVTDPEDYRRLFEYNQQVVSALGFRDGSTHHELFVRRDADGGLSLKFIEIAARVPGGLGVPFHERNSGINLIDANLLLALGDPAADAPAFKSNNNVVSALLPVGHGKVVARNEPEVGSEYWIDWRISVGDTVDSRSLVDNAGILTMVNDDAVTLRRDFESLQNYVPVSCE